MPQSEDRNPTKIYRRWVVLWFLAAIKPRDPKMPRRKRWLKTSVSISFLSFVLFLLIAPASIRWWVVFAEHTDATWEIARNMTAHVHITRPA